jgi:hypothetical protein
MDVPPSGHILLNMIYMEAKMAWSLTTMSFHLSSQGCIFLYFHGRWLAEEATVAWLATTMPFHLPPKDIIFFFSMDNVLERRSN